MFCCALCICFPVLQRQLIALLCHTGRLVIVIVLWPFLRVQWVGLQCLIVLSPDHAHLIFERFNDDPDIKLSSAGWCLSNAGPTMAQLKGFFSSDYP